MLREAGLRQIDPLSCLSTPLAAINDLASRQVGLIALIVEFS